MTLDPESLRQLQMEIETFLTSLRHPLLVEDGRELFDLTDGEWRVTVQAAGLVLEAWSAGRSLVRRIEQVAFQDRNRLGVFVRKPGGRDSATLELRELEAEAEGAADRASRRGDFRRQSLALLQDQFPGWRFDRVSNRSDREHSFSAWYTRGLMRQGRTGWAFLALNDAESPAAGDSALAYGLIWLDWLRAQSDRLPVVGLKLLLPEQAVAASCHRAAYLNRRAAQIEVWSLAQGRLATVDLKDFGNVETRLSPCSVTEESLRRFEQRHGGLLRRLAGEDFDHFEVVPEAGGNGFALRLRGLEVARVEGQLAPRLYFGLEGSSRRLEENNQEEFSQLVKSVLELRQAQSADASHEFYRLQPERWLESLVVEDVTRVDPSLAPDYVYPQVPAFAAADRGVIDVLAVNRQGRLAVIELKLQEEINLLMQGLDYWLRVKWLNERGQFHPYGYFTGLELSPRPPLLYIVSPAFRFHSTFGRMTRYLDQGVEVVQVGLNSGWREGVRVLFRRQLNEAV